MNKSLISNDIVIGIFQELFINELAVMRAAEPLTEGRETSNGIIYLSDFPSMVDISTPRRALDISIVVYSILNGLRRMLGRVADKYNLHKCIYDVSKMSEWPKECNVLKLLRAAINELGLRTYKPMGAENEFTEYLTSIILFLIDNGLLIPLPYSAAKNSPVPVKFMNIEDRKGSFIRLQPKELVDLVSIKIAMIFNKYFGQVLRSANIQTNPYQVLLRIYNNVLSQLGLANLHDLERRILFFKTRYGELLRNMYNSKPLPINLINFEGRVLPFLLEIRPFSSKTHDLSEIEPLIIRFFTKSGISDDKAKIIAEIIIESLRKTGIKSISEYQYSYLRSIPDKALNEEEPVRALLASPTGTGKTLVFTLYSIILAILGKMTHKVKEYKSLIIYPRKALATDQLLKLVNLIYLINQGLESKKDELGRKILISIGIRDGDSPKTRDISNEGNPQPLRDLAIKIDKDSEVKIFHYYSKTDGYCVFINNEKLCRSDAFIKDIKSNEIFTSDIIVTNHSMLNKILTDSLLLGKKSIKINDFIAKLKLLVIDEAHIFLERKLAFLLQAGLIKLYYLKGKAVSAENDKALIRVGISRLDIVLSSATITNRSLVRIKLDDNTIATMPSRNIIGVFRFRIKEDVNDINEIRKIFSRLILECNDKFTEGLIYMDYYSTLADQNIIRNYHGLYKIRSSAIIVPYPYRSSWTSLNESMISLLHLIHSNRKRKIVSTSLVFVDSKETLRHIFNVFNSRQIIEAKDHIDRVLLTLLEKYDKKRTKAHETISKVIMKQYDRSLYDVIWDLNRDNEYFSSFHNLSFYLNTNDLKTLANTKIPKNGRKLKNILRQYRLFSTLLDDMDNITEYSKLIVNNGIFKHLASNDELLVNRSLDTLKQYVSKTLNPLYFIVHHGSLNRRARNYIEGTLKPNKFKQCIPYIIMSTSTLEVGIDIPYISVVVQYGTDALSQELQQRFGRSGRSRESMYISLGVLILRNRGEDLSYINDQEATNYIYSLRIPVVPRIIDEPMELFRHLTGILMERYGRLEREIHKDKGAFKERLRKEKSHYDNAFDELSKLLNDLSFTYCDDKSSLKLSLRYIKQYVFDKWFKDTMEYLYIIETDAEHHDISNIDSAINNVLNLISSYIGEIEEKQFSEKLNNIKRKIEIIMNSINTLIYKYSRQKYCNRLDIMLEIYAILAHVLSYNVIELLKEVVRMEISAKDIDSRELGSLKQIIMKGIGDPLHFMLKITSYELMKILKSKFGNVYTIFDIIRWLSFIYPPGYINPFTYDENLYKLINFAAREKVHRRNRFPNIVDFYELIMKSRILHTR